MTGRGRTLGRSADDESRMRRTSWRRTCPQARESARARGARGAGARARARAHTPAFDARRASGGAFDGRSDRPRGRAAGPHPVPLADPRLLGSRAHLRLAGTAGDAAARRPHGDVDGGVLGGDPGAGPAGGSGRPRTGNRRPGAAPDTLAVHPARATAGHGKAVVRGTGPGRGTGRRPAAVPRTLRFARRHLAGPRPRRHGPPPEGPPHGGRRRGPHPMADHPAPTAQSLADFYDTLAVR